MAYCWFGSRLNGRDAWPRNQPAGEPAAGLMMAEMVAENILDESDSTSFVTTWRNSNSRTMTDARLTLQEIFDFVEKGLAPHPPQQSSPLLFGAGGTIQVSDTQLH